MFKFEDKNKYFFFQTRSALNLDTVSDMGSDMESVMESDMVSYTKLLPDTTSARLPATVTHPSVPTSRFLPAPRFPTRFPTPSKFPSAPTFPRSTASTPTLKFRKLSASMSRGRLARMFPNR